MFMTLAGGEMTIVYLWAMDFAEMAFPALYVDYLDVLAGEFVAGV
jgi:hypothetical protein